MSKNLAAKSNLLALLHPYMVFVARCYCFIPSSILSPDDVSNMSSLLGKRHYLDIIPEDTEKNHLMELKYMLKLHALLETFQMHGVRDDFIAGKVVALRDPGLILSSLDVMERIIFPKWLQSHEKRESEMKASSVHLRLLWEESPLNFVLSLNDKKLPLFSYKAWAEAIDEIFNSTYWTEKVSPSVNIV